MELDLFGIKLQTPRYDYYISLFGSNTLLLPHKYMKIIAFLFLIAGLSYTKRYLSFLISRFYIYYRTFTLPSKISSKSKQWVVILGFGDNINSVTIAKYFANKGYNLLLLADINVLKVRKEYNLNEIQEITKLTDVEIVEFDYTTFSSFNEFELNGLISYVFDTSVLRLYNNDLSESDKKNHLSSLFNNDAISSWLNTYMKIFDILKNYFNVELSNVIKFFCFNYPDKSEEVNHKLFFDIRRALYGNYQEIYKSNFIFANIVFVNEFRGTYISERSLNLLEVLDSKNKSYICNKISDDSTGMELSFI